MIEAMVISVGEPQLDRCLESVKNQTVSFSNVIHLDGVVPNSEAFNRGIRMTTNEWIMHIAGDTILYPNAVEIGEKYIKNVNPVICGYCFWILDTFLECNTGFCSVFRTEAFRQVEFKDTLWDDRHMMQRLRTKGWRMRKPRDVIATHFDKPDDLQVFGRFYFHGSKFADNSFVKTRMGELYKKYGNPLYMTGMKAIEFAKVKGYVGSPNIDLVRKMYKEFNEDFNRHSCTEQSQDSSKTDQAL